MSTARKDAEALVAHGLVTPAPKLQHLLAVLEADGETGIPPKDLAALVLRGLDLIQRQCATYSNPDARKLGKDAAAIAGFDGMRQLFEVLWLECITREIGKNARGSHPTSFNYAWEGIAEWCA